MIPLLFSAIPIIGPSNTKSTTHIWNLFSQLAIARLFISALLFSFSSKFAAIISHSQICHTILVHGSLYHQLLCHGLTCWQTSNIQIKMFMLIDFWIRNWRPHRKSESPNVPSVYKYSLWSSFKERFSWLPSLVRASAISFLSFQK